MPSTRSAGGSAGATDRLYDTANGSVKASVPSPPTQSSPPPPIAGVLQEQQNAYDDGRVAGPGDALYRRAVGVDGGGSYGYEETTLGNPPTGAGSYPEPVENYEQVRAERAPAAAPVVAVVRRGSSGSTGIADVHDNMRSAVANGGPREDSGEQWGDLIPPLLAALSAAGGGGGEERRIALAQLGNLSQRAAPTLWTRYFGQLLLLVLELLHDQDAHTREAVRLPQPAPMHCRFVSTFLFANPLGSAADVHGLY